VPLWPPRTQAATSIREIAAHCLVLADAATKRAVIASIHKLHPRYQVNDIRSTFIPASDIEALFRQAAKRFDATDANA